jgi:aspartate ammonia-lyase
MDLGLDGISKIFEIAFYGIHTARSVATFTREHDLFH